MYAFHALTDVSQEHSADVQKQHVITREEKVCMTYTYVTCTCTQLKALQRMYCQPACTDIITLMDDGVLALVILLHEVGMGPVSLLLLNIKA